MSTLRALLETKGAAIVCPLRAQARVASPAPAFYVERTRMPLTVHHYPTCSTCRKALKWLDAHEIAHARVHIVEQPPTAAQLSQALDAGLPLRALFNTSGESYREGNFKTRLPEMSEREALAALTADGKLIKRPFAIGKGVVLVGFDEAAWQSALM